MAEDLYKLLDGQVSACGVCGLGGLKTLLDLGSQPVAERMGAGPSYPLILMECHNCGLVQLSHMVPQRLLFPANHPFATGNTPALREHFRDLAEGIMSGLKTGDLWVDIGANDGTLLEAAAGHGLRRVAVEPTGQAAKCREKGITTYQEYFTIRLAAQIREVHRGAAVITATNVLAHVPDVHAFMDGVLALLGPGGSFITENHDLASITDGLQFDRVYHEHLRYFSLASLSRLLAIHGLQVYSTERLFTQGGSLRVIAHRRKGGLAERAADAARSLHDLLSMLALDGELIYGVGAATSAVPLIHYAKIAPYLTCVCEVPASEKIGAFMPGTRIPVVDEVKLLEDQPGYALIFPYYIARQLIAKLKDAGYKGQFIIPLPRAEVTDG